MTTLYRRMAHTIDLRIPHFLKTVKVGEVLQRSPVDRPTEEWYGEFVERARSAIGTRHFPIFRFGDGECLFASGYRLPAPRRGESVVRHYGHHILSAYVKHRLYRNFRSGYDKYGYELYNHAEWMYGRARFAEYLRNIVRDGVIGFNFVIQSGTPFADRFLKPVCDWLDRERISIDAKSFIPCYFVYGMLIGPDRSLFIRNRNVLVVTSMDANKRKQFVEGFKREGAKSVQFLSISRSKSMLEVIDISGIEGPIDVALVGAGVGASNILEQLRPLGTVCIDSGYALDCIAEPERRGTRVFTRPDDEGSAVNRDA